jgi:hypothetical protein
LVDITVKEIGKSITFEAEISKEGLPVNWFFGSKQIRRDDKHDLSVDGKIHKLVIDKVDSGDIGEYSISYQTLKSTAKLSVEGELMISFM